MTLAPPPPPRKSGMPRWLIILLVILLVIALGCCGGVVTCVYVVKRAGQAGISFLQSQVEEFAKQAGAKTDLTGSGLPLPSRMPPEITIYPGMKARVTVEPPGKRSAQALLRDSPDAPQDIMDYYDQQLTAAGWAATGDIPSGDNLTQAYTKGRDRITITTNGPKGSATTQIIYEKAAEPTEPTDDPAKPEATPPTLTPAPNEPGARATPTTPANDDRPETPLQAASPLPADFPADIPIMKELRPVNKYWDKTKGTGWINLQSKTEAAKIVAYYEKELPTQGWKIDQNMDLGSANVLALSKGARQLGITVMPDAETHITNVTLTYKKE